MSAPLSVQYDAVEALADELAALATQLAEEQPLCRTAAASLRAALLGDVGWRSGAAAAAWGSLMGLIAQECEAMAATLHAAVDSYRTIDAGIARSVLPGRARAGAGPR
jgi:hypothetical protein